MAVALLAPVLVNKFGLPLMPVHLFFLFYACLSAISLNSGVTNMINSRGVTYVKRNIQYRNQSIRSKSLMLVLARVCASTCLTMTAQYRLHLPSGDGIEPGTTTEPAGTRPYSTWPVSR